MSEKQTDLCWLCGKPAELTKEHIPARRAFNDSSQIIALQRVSEEAAARGVLRWQSDRLYRDGFSRLSLCEACNKQSGRRFVNSYAALTDEVARLGERVPCGYHFMVPKVQNPHLVLRQILHQFVTANGREFVVANPWLREFITDLRQKKLPENVFVYIFAMKERTMRITGVGGTIFLDKGRFAVLSEFSFWPIGTVLSFQELHDPQLTPIRNWAEINLRAKLSLCMSHALAPSFIDFRSAADIQLAAFKTSPSFKVPPDDLLKAMTDECEKRAGRADKFTYVVHPSLGRA